MHPRSRQRVITTRFATYPLANCSGCWWRHAEPANVQPHYETLEAFMAHPAVKAARENLQKRRDAAAERKRTKAQACNGKGCA